MTPTHNGGLQSETGKKGVNISISQHSVGDFTVTWLNADGRGREQYFTYDLGGAISFAFGLKAGALARGETVEMSLKLENPLLNQGFQEGFLRGINHSASIREEFDPAELATDRLSGYDPTPVTPWLQDFTDCLREAFKPCVTRI